MFSQLFLLHYFSKWVQKTFQTKVKKINNISIILLVLLLLHYLLIIASFMICNLFNLRGLFINTFMRGKKNCLILILIFSLVYISSSIFLLHRYDILKLQILNFFFSFLIIFEVCIKIAYSEKFINWIGEELDKTFRLLIMFIICLNCSYFFTRITYQVLRSY